MGNEISNNNYNNNNNEYSYILYAENNNRTGFLGKWLKGKSTTEKFILTDTTYTYDYYYLPAGSGDNDDYYVKNKEIVLKIPDDMRENFGGRSLGNKI